MYFIKKYFPTANYTKLNKHSTVGRWCNSHIEAVTLVTKFRSSIVCQHNLERVSGGSGGSHYETVVNIIFPEQKYPGQSQINNLAESGRMW